MKKVSVFIPVYREAELLEELLKGLIKDPYKKKEIFVVIDEPTERSLEIVRKYNKKVKFILNEKRKGKVNALNQVIKLASGDIFLFLDSDVKIPNVCRNFLKTVVKSIGEADIIEIKKRIIRESFISKIIGYDYMSFNLVNYLFSKTLQKCIGVNGAAFAIKREVFEELGGFKRVVSEDLDIGTRAFLNGNKFKYVYEIEVLNKSPSSWKEWFKQRNRWGLGAALWFKSYYKQLFKIIAKHPQVLLPSLLFIFPSLILFILNSILSSTLIEKILTISLVFLSAQMSFLIPFLSLTSTSVFLIKNVILSALSYTIFASFFYIFAKKLRYHFNPVEFALYFFLYCPIWLFIVAVSFIKVLLLSSHISTIQLKDWKV